MVRLFDYNLFCYLDDLIIVKNIYHCWKRYSKSETKLGLAINLKTSDFYKSRLRYPGFIIDEKGLRIDPAKIKAISNISRPKRTKEIKGFLGLAGCYKRFIMKKISTIVVPLHKITDTHKGVSNFLWSPEIEEAIIICESVIISK